MDCVCVCQSVKQTPSSYGNPRGRRRSSFNLPSPDYLAAAAPSSVKWQTKLQQQRVPLATAQSVRPAAKARKLRVCLSFSEHPAAPSLLQLLIKQVSYLSHHHSIPLPPEYPTLCMECSMVQAGGRNVNAVTQFALAMSLFSGLTPFMLYDFSHAHPWPRPPLAALKARLWQHLERRNRGDNGRWLANPQTPELLTLSVLQFKNFLCWRILHFDNLLQVIDKHNAR